MTPELRDWLKAERDRIVRARETHGLARDECAGCGCDLDVYVDGCKTCWGRRYNRERRSSRQATCSRCGVPLKQHRSGCSTCRERHKKRRLGRNWERDRIYQRERRERMKAA